MEDQRISRLERRQVDLPPAPVASGGGVSGITRVWAWSLTTNTLGGDVTVTPAGTFDVTQRWGESVGVTQDGTGLTLPEGLYMVTVDYDLAFSDATVLPSAGRAWLDYDGADYHYPVTISPIVEDLIAGGTSMAGTWTVGPLPVSGSLTFGASWVGSNDSVFVNWWTLDIAKVG